MPRRRLHSLHLRGHGGGLLLLGPPRRLTLGHISLHCQFLQRPCLLLPRLLQRCLHPAPPGLLHIRHRALPRLPAHRQGKVVLLLDLQRCSLRLKACHLQLRCRLVRGEVQRFLPFLARRFVCRGERHVALVHHLFHDGSSPRGVKLLGLLPRFPYVPRRRILRLLHPRLQRDLRGRRVCRHSTSHHLALLGPVLRLRHRRLGRRVHALPFHVRFVDHHAPLLARLVRP